MGGARGSLILSWRKSLNVTWVVTSSKTRTVLLFLALYVHSQVREKRSTFCERLCFYSSIFSTETFRSAEWCSKEQSISGVSTKKSPRLMGGRGRGDFLFCLLWRRFDSRAHKARSPITFSWTDITFLWWFRSTIERTRGEVRLDSMFSFPT